MIRRSGLYAVHRGEELPVEVRARDYVTVSRPAGRNRIDLDDLDDLLKVTTTATWRGGKVHVSDVAGDEAGFMTSDRRLAEAEGLSGDQYGGWTGSAPLGELSEVSERVTSVHPRRRRA